MTYQERRSIVSIISTIVISAVYFALVLQRYPDADAYSQEVFKFWGSAILLLIPITIAAKIIIYIVFVILNTIATREMEPTVTDERDRLIELRSDRIGLYVMALGFLLAMVTIVLDQEPSVMFIMLIMGGIVSDILSELSQFYFYRRGF